MQSFTILPQSYSTDPRIASVCDLLCDIKKLPLATVHKVIITPHLVSFEVYDIDTEGHKHMNADRTRAAMHTEILRRDNADVLTILSSG